MQNLSPLEEFNRPKKSAQPCVMVIFGATGDLTARKLIPALYNLEHDGELPAHFACVGFARRSKTNEEFRGEMLAKVQEFSRTKPISEAVWEQFSNQLFYHQSEFHEDEGYEKLKKLLNELDEKFDTHGNRVYYLSTQPSFFSLIIQKLSEHGLISPYSEHSEQHFTRVIIEKPFGHDLSSAQVLQNSLTKYLDENQIYRIDHYLGKETVQNLMTLRFSNPIFESLWNNHHIEQVQITVSEEQGIGTRGLFWEEAGMLRDIVQNHMMQLLSIIAMEPPNSLEANAIRNEKVKVMQSVRPIPKNQIDHDVIRGQYDNGYIEGEEVCAYRQEKNVDPLSNVETYVAMELFIDNWRWAGVPFYLRAGKRMPKRITEIAIVFKQVPNYLFSNNNEFPNTLVIRIQPNEGISLKMNCKVPGMTHLQPVKMDFRYGSYFGGAPPEAYERLICDCLSGDNTLFARFDELLASWKLLTPVLDHWAQTPPEHFPNYHAGTWGPKTADAILRRVGRTWRLL